MSRTQEEIRQEYTRCAMEAGDKIFRIQLLNAQVGELHKKMHALTNEVPVKEEEKAASE